MSYFTSSTSTRRLRASGEGWSGRESPKPMVLMRSAATPAFTRYAFYGLGPLFRQNLVFARLANPVGVARHAHAQRRPRL